MQQCLPRDSEPSPAVPPVSVTMLARGGVHYRLTAARVAPRGFASSASGSASRGPSSRRRHDGQGNSGAAQASRASSQQQLKPRYGTLSWRKESRSDGVCFSAGPADLEGFNGYKDVKVDHLRGVAGLDPEEREPAFASPDAEISLDDEKAFEEIYVQTLRSDPLTFMRPGMRVKTTYVSTNTGGAYYDFGSGDLVTPRPIHNGQTSAGKGTNAANLRAAAAASPQEGGSRVHFEGSMAVPMEKSDLMLYEGQYLPDFSESGSVKGNDPTSLTWSMLEQAYRRKKPFKGRILNPINGGFAVAVGTVVGFLPNSHVSPFLRGPSSKQWLARTQNIVGEAVWLQVITMDREENNLVVSHRTVPRHLLLPTLSESRGSPRRRSGPIPLPSVPAAEDTPAAAKKDTDGAPETKTSSA